MTKWVIQRTTDNCYLTTRTEGGINFNYEKELERAYLFNYKNEAMRSLTFTYDTVVPIEIEIKGIKR
jgi:hypothetical protein